MTSATTPTSPAPTTQNSTKPTALSPVPECTISELWGQTQDLADKATATLKASQTRQEEQTEGLKKKYSITPTPSAPTKK
jgi:hypothetical protein